MSTLLILLAVLIPTALVWWVWSMKGAGQGENHAAGIPAGVSVRGRPLMTKSKAALYNLMRLAVQEQYLVFAQVPVWCLVDVRAQDHRARMEFLNKISFNRVDFVLVHPGTLAVAKVVELDDQPHASGQRQIRDRLIDAVFNEAGIALVRLKAQQSYTVPALTALLGVEPLE
ncbi:MAG TPA: DUF2726 domain-containing protein [Nitrospiraceae bacterium]|nr:DUF2726 domain-containing protein [Nitrospiraceae bacterium]